MMFLGIGVGALVTMTISLWRTIAGDAYGLRPPPRSRHDELEFDAKGLPIKHLARR
jgi:hypothetical protein